MSVGVAIQDGGSGWAEDGLGRFIETGDSVGRRVLCLVMTVVLKGERGGVVQSGPLVVAQGGGGGGLGEWEGRPKCWGWEGVSRSEVRAPDVGAITLVSRSAPE